MVKLGVNIDHVATLREARGGVEPSVLNAAKVCEQSGADGITVHLREDRRHIQDKDVDDILKNINLPLNLEMALSDEIITKALCWGPSSVCIVPEKREELTTEGGLNVIGNFSRIEASAEQFNAKSIKVSLFIDPDQEQIKAAAETGAGFIELHTGDYANALSEEMIAKELERLIEAADFARGLGLTVNAGHGLNYCNVKPVAAIKEMFELNIGHSIVARAVFTGLADAVKEMKRLIS